MNDGSGSRNSVEKSEFIGRRITIISAGAKNAIGKNVTVIDETKDTFLVDIGAKEIRLIKEQLVFSIDGRTIDGKTIALRPEERIKRIKKG